ncbi:NAD(P)/FAD-dependent oxidoreductase [Trinickia sp. LjRoot230]|uniref:FAD-dependent oxidoreductase n=1 Tax=Trinickia sp. LjRoot230 TaxID=3342288 RepID=UPI003ECCCF9C
MTHEFDIAVIGAGPAGLAAACAAARHGKRVALIDDNPRAGGQVWRQTPQQPAAAPLRRALATLHENDGVAIFVATRVVAPLPPNALLFESADGRAETISYSELILATGARERILPVAGWTLPGVTGAGALQALIKGGMPVRGERLVIAGTGPLLMAALATARRAGAEVIAVVEQASLPSVARFGASLLATPSKLWQAACLTRGFFGLRYWSGSIVREVRGHGRVQSVVVRRGSRDVVLECDRLAYGYGLVPNAMLALALGCEVDAKGGAIAVDQTQRTSLGGIWAAGECTGIGGMELASVEGEIAGLAASGVPVPHELMLRRRRWQRFAARVAHAFTLGTLVGEVPSDDTLLCRCEDVTFGEVAEHTSWRDAKLHTRCGMGPCQGQICGMAAQFYFGWACAAPRPPLRPARIATLLAAATGGHAHSIIEPYSTLERDA